MNFASRCGGVVSGHVLVLANNGTSMAAPRQIQTRCVRIDFLDLSQPKYKQFCKEVVRSKCKNVAEDVCSIKRVIRKWKSDQVR